VESDARKFEALLRADFRPFLEKVFAAISPGQTYTPACHLEAIALQLERIRRGEIVIRRGPLTPLSSKISEACDADRLRDPAPNHRKSSQRSSMNGSKAIRNATE
jgi:hypothetical protein